MYGESSFDLVVGVRLVWESLSCFGLAAAVVTPGGIWDLL